MTDDDRVTLRVRDREFWGWTSAEITMSMREACRAFAVSLSGPYVTLGGLVAEGDRVQLLVGTDVVITGRVDDFDIGGDADTIRVHIAGRSKTRNIVDCSAPLGSWTNRTILGLAQLLTARYDLAFVDEAGVGSKVVRRHKTDEGDTIFDALDGLGREHGFLVTDDGLGRVVFTTAGAAGIERGDHIERGTSSFLSGDAKRSGRERFSTYVVKGQTAEDEVTSGDATDADIDDFRELIIRPEKGLSTKDAQARAKWESATRAANALAYSCLLTGWRWRNGRLRQPNTIVAVLDRLCRIYWLDLLVVSVTLSLTADEGRKCSLELGPREGFTPPPTKSVSTTGYSYDAPEGTAPDLGIEDEGF